MRAVWSFWSLPHRAYYHRAWRSDFHHVLSWVLSVHEARKHYPETALVTDSAGAQLLVDRLGLPFDHVDLALDRLESTEEWWVLGKLTAYSRQTTPFIHIDSDAYLWKPLPAAVTAAPVFAQNPEFFRLRHQPLYRLDAFLAGIEQFGGWIPQELQWYAATRGTAALCCGILGGNDVAFIRHYADQAIATIRHPRNQAVWPSLGIRDNILVEQYFLSACLRYHRQSASSPHRGVKARYLFPSSKAAFDPPAASKAGYTHLIGDAKNNQGIAEQLDRRVRSDYPESYERCRALADSQRA